MRFPNELAEALDELAAERQSSRSELVEELIMSTTLEDRADILETPLPATAGGRRNFSLGREAVNHLKTIAGEIPPADFLRRTVAYVVGADYSASETNGPPRPDLRLHPRYSQGISPNPLVVFFVATAVVALGALIAWGIRRWTEDSDVTPPASGSTPPAQGQLGPGSPSDEGA
jgi:hypothetical protein